MDEIIVNVEDMPSSSSVMKELDELLLGGNSNRSGVGFKVDKEDEFKLDIEDISSSSSSSSSSSTSSGSVPPQASKGNTWDGYTYTNTIPENPDSKLSKEEMMKQKLFYLYEFEKLSKKKKIKLTKEYTIESSLSEMKAEYDAHRAIYEKQNSILFQYYNIKSVVWGLEYINGLYDPFGIDLEGWSAVIEESPEEFEEPLGELYEKYKSSGQYSPELKLAYALVYSGIRVASSNYASKAFNVNNGPASMDTMFSQNPEFLNAFTQNTYQSAFQGGGAGGAPPMPSNQRMPVPPPATPQAVPRYNPQVQGVPPVRMGGPGAGGFPAPIDTRPPPRSDVSVARGQDLPMRSSIFAGPPGTRPEMEGPSSKIEHILSGMKTTELSISEAPFLNVNAFTQPSLAPSAPPVPVPTQPNKSMTLDEISLTSQSQKKKGRPRKNAQLSQNSRNNIMALDL